MFNGIEQSPILHVGTTVYQAEGYENTYVEEKLDLDVMVDNIYDGLPPWKDPLAENETWGYEILRLHFKWHNDQGASPEPSAIYSAQVTYSNIGSMLSFWDGQNICPQIESFYGLSGNAANFNDMVFSRDLTDGMGRGVYVGPHWDNNPAPDDYRCVWLGMNTANLEEIAGLEMWIEMRLVKMNRLASAYLTPFIYL